MWSVVYSVMIHISPCLNSMTDKQKTSSSLLDEEKKPNVFGFFDTVTFREGDKAGVEYQVIGYQNDGRVELSDQKRQLLTAFQEKLLLIKNGIIFQKDDIVKIKDDGLKLNPDDIPMIKNHYLPNTNHFSVLRVSHIDGLIDIGNPNNFKDDGTGKRVGKCISVFPSQLELISKKIQIYKRHGPDDTEITLFLPTSHKIMHCDGTILTTQVKEQMISKGLAWIGYKNNAWYSLKCIKQVNKCMKNIVPHTKYWKDKNDIRITRVVITDDLRFHRINDTSAKYDWALIGNTQLNRNFKGLNRPLEPSKVSTNDNLTDPSYELEILYDEEGNPVFNTEKKEEKNFFMQMMYAAMGDLLQQQDLSPISRATQVIPENRVQTVKELPLATEVIPIDDYQRNLF